MRDDPIYAEQHEQVRRMQERVARGGPLTAVAGPPIDPNYKVGQRRVRFDPRMSQTPKSGHLGPLPGPKGVAPVGKITGSGPGYISRKIDPTNKYHNIELQTGEDVEYEEYYDGLKHLVRLVFITLLVAGIFVVPLDYRPFWIVITSLVILSGMAFQLYVEWDSKAFDESVSAEEQASSKGWASSLLYLISMVTSAVIVGILLVMMWKIYTVTRKNSNLLGTDPGAGDVPPVDEYGMPPEEPVYPAPMPEYHDFPPPPMMYDMGREKKRSKRHRGF